MNEQGPHTQGTLAAIDQLYRESGGDVLGLIPDKAEGAASAEREDGLIRLLVDLHAEARAHKDWATSDKIRDLLKALGVILEDRRAPEITPAVVRYSASAAEHLLIAQVTNLAQTIRQLKTAGIWIVGLDLSDRATPLG